MISRLLLLLCAPVVALAQAPDLSKVTLLDLAGQQVSASDYLGGGVRVLTYTGIGCPICGKYAARLEQLSQRFAQRGVKFIGVNANPQDSRAAIEKEAGELGLSFPMLRDFRQELTRALGATTTTEVFLFDAAGVLRYRGALDDQHSLGASKPDPTETWLLDALESVLAGEQPAVTETPAPGCALTLLAPEQLPEAITWSSHVADIIQRKCTSCHREGQVGPFALETYSQARGWSEMIAAVVDEGRMPPWNAHPRFNRVFANERRLSNKEKAQLLRWIEDGTPRGNPDEDPAPRTWPEGWRIGQPDAVFAMERTRRGAPLPEQGYAVPREGVIDYQYFTAQTSFEEDRWVQAIEVKPGAADVVHHVLILIEDPAARGPRTDFRSYFAVAVPGDTPSIYPDGYGKKLPAGARLIFQLHYTPNGKERFDRSSVALRFCEQPPIFEVRTSAVVDNDFRIPPGDEDFEVRASIKVPEDTPVLGFFPHMHTRGKDFSYMLHLPDGTSEELLATDFDFNWQESYLLGDPRVLPAGSRLECIGHFDNSKSNLANPDPEAWVGWGDQTFEEMFIGYFDYVRPIDG